MNTKLLFILVALAAIIPFANCAWATAYAYVYKDGGLAVTYDGTTAFKEAVDTANANADIDSIYLYGDDGTTAFASTPAANFWITADNLTITFHKDAEYSDAIYLWGDNIKMCGEEGHGDILYIATGDGRGIYVSGDSENITIEDCDIDAGSYGIDNYGENVEMSYLNISNCSVAGIHSDAVDAEIYRAKIDDCEQGIRGHGYGNNLDVEKVLITDCGYGCYFYDSISVTIDQSTIHTFTSDGIHNGTNTDDGFVIFPRKNGQLFKPYFLKFSGGHISQC